MKFSLFISNRAAAAINDTDMGSSPDIAALMYFVVLAFHEEVRDEQYQDERGKTYCNGGHDSLPTRFE